MKLKMLLINKVFFAELIFHSANMAKKPIYVLVFHTDDANKHLFLSDIT